MFGPPMLIIFAERVPETNKGKVQTDGRRGLEQKPVVQSICGHHSDRLVSWVQQPRNSREQL